MQGAERCLKQSQSGVVGSTLCKARETGLKLGREERLKRGGESYVGGVCARVDVMSCLATMRGIVERCVDVNVAAGAMCVVSRAALRAWRRARCGRHRVRRHCGHVVVSIAGSSLAVRSDLLPCAGGVGSRGRECSFFLLALRLVVLPPLGLGDHPGC